MLGLVSSMTIRIRQNSFLASIMYDRHYSPFEITQHTLYNPKLVLYILLFGSSLAEAWLDFHRHSGSAIRRLDFATRLLDSASISLGQVTARWFLGPVLYLIRTKTRIQTQRFLYVCNTNLLVAFACGPIEISVQTRPYRIGVSIA